MFAVLSTPQRTGSVVGHHMISDDSPLAQILASAIDARRVDENLPRWRRTGGVGGDDGADRRAGLVPGGCWPVSPPGRWSPPRRLRDRRRLVDDPPAAAGPPSFVDETASSGIDHVYDGEFTFFVGGGVAVFDCNDDGRQDLFFAGGTTRRPCIATRALSAGGCASPRLPTPRPTSTEVTGAYPLDVDSDGHIDLAVLRVGENVMLRGLGDCRFERANDAGASTAETTGPPPSAPRGKDPASLPTLAFGNYLELDATGEQTGRCADNVLFQADGHREATAIRSR